MKYVFLISFAFLSLGSASLFFTLPEQRTGMPVLYWGTHGDQVKQATIDLFYEWRKEKGLPPVEVRIDIANSDQTKKLIQGVSGVAADFLDLYDSQTYTMQTTGMLLDLTPYAEDYGITPEETYESVKNYIMIDGRQYGFPRNLGATMTWFNRETLRKYGLEDPPQRWTWDEFEAFGTRFVEAANRQGGEKDRKFFIDNVNSEVLRRGLGLSTYNETMTACTLDDPRNVEVLRRIQYWNRELRLFPTKQEAAAYASDVSGSGARFSFFDEGRYAMLNVPRWALIMLRPRLEQRGRPFDLGVVEPAHSGYPNVQVGIGVIGVYKKTDHIEESLQFLQFLTSERFNLLVAKSGDSLPPVPEFAFHPAYYQPPDHPEEWGLHEPFAKAAREIAIPVSISPYVVDSQIRRIQTNVSDALYAGQITPEEAAREQAQRINEIIQLTISRNPRLAERYKKEVALQKKIDAYRAEGKPIPASWIKNPFHQKFYRDMGWILNDAEAE